MCLNGILQNDELKKWKCIKMNSIIQFKISIRKFSQFKSFKLHSVLAKNEILIGTNYSDELYTGKGLRNCVIELECNRDFTETGLYTS